MSKAWISTVVCGSLAVFTGLQVFNALDAQKGLDSQQALYRAEQSLSEISQRHGIPAQGLRLMEEIAPAQGQATWHFVFKNPSQKSVVSIDVNEQGQAHEGTIHSS